MASTKTAAAILGAATLGALAWIGSAAGAQRTPVPDGTGGGSGSGTKPVMSWGCEGASGRACLMCCLDLGSRMREYCLSRGFQEGFCHDLGEDLTTSCQGSACGA